MKAKRRYQYEGPTPGRPTSSDEDDFQHLMECREKDCWYCSDRPDPEAQRDPEVQAWLDSIESQHLSRPAA